MKPGQLIWRLPLVVAFTGVVCLAAPVLGHERDVIDDNGNPIWNPQEDIVIDGDHMLMGNNTTDYWVRITFFDDDDGTHGTHDRPPLTNYFLWISEAATRVCVEKLFDPRENPQDCLGISGSSGNLTISPHGNVDALETNGDPCGTLIPADLLCEDTDPNSQPDSFGVEWFIALAAGANPLAFTTITFGIGDYDPYACYVAGFGPCPDEGGGMPLEIPSAGWPGPFTGTSVSWAPFCREGMVVPVYFFGFYVYYGGGPVPFGDFFPGQTATVVSCDDPPIEELITGFGVMGCGDDPGLQVCPEETPMEGACCVDGNGDGNPETCIDIPGEDECTSLGGIYQGDGTACGPNNEPCPEDEPVATQQTTWGQIKAIYR